MSPRLGDLAYLLGKAHDIEFNIVSLKGGKAVMNALNAGDVDIGWGAGVQTKAVVAGLSHKRKRKLKQVEQAITS